MKKELVEKYTRITKTITTKTGTVRNSKCYKTFSVWRKNAERHIVYKMKSDLGKLDKRWFNMKRKLGLSTQLSMMNRNFRTSTAGSRRCYRGRCGCGRSYRGRCRRRKAVHVEKLTCQRLRRARRLHCCPCCAAKAKHHHHHHHHHHKKSHHHHHHKKSHHHHHHHKKRHHHHHHKRAA